MEYKQSRPTTKKVLLNHFKFLQRAAVSFSLVPILNCINFQVTIRSKSKNHIFYPQFITRFNNHTEYTSTFSYQKQRFAGWKPYCTRNIPEFSNKLKFKEQLILQGFTVPQFSQDINCNLNNVIVKKIQGAFSENIKGPFKETAEYGQFQANEEYFEQFIYGKIVKIHFWNANPITMEYLDMPFVEGDGKTDICNLLRQHFYYKDKEINYDEVNAVLKFYNKTLSTILVKGERQIVDFRYSSPLIRMVELKEISLLLNPIPDLCNQLIQLGKFLFTVILKNDYKLFAYTVDAIWTKSNILYILEANANPFIHPHLYVPMLHSLESI